MTGYTTLSSGTIVEIYVRKQHDTPKGNRMNKADLAPRKRIAILRWVLPLAFAIMAALYQLGPARWVHTNYGDPVHFGIEILFYGTAGPVLAFWALTVVGRWIDDKEQAERLAQASERCLASITSASADAILGLSSAGQVETWNRGAELLFGYNADEIRGQPLTDLLGQGEAAQVEYRWLDETVRREGFIRGHEAVAWSAAGREVVVEITATLLTDEAGKAIGMSVILRDITERKRREEEIRRLNTRLNELVAQRTAQLAEKLDELARANSDLQQLDRMRSEFVSLVSHQIRAPLTNIRGAAERMQAGCGAVTPTCTRMFAILHQQVARLDRLVQDVLGAARIEAGELVLHLEPTSLLPVVSQVVDQVRARTVDRPFRLPTKPGLPLVLADRDRLAEVLANLLDNADKYSAPGAEVTIEARADETEVTLSVRDFGPGLPLENLERVFDKYYRADSSDSQLAYGYGLGLYVCRRLVEAHGGHIWAENAPDGGVVFSFALPVAQ